MTAEKKVISIIGAVGIPANYGGFETLVENLAIFHHKNEVSQKLIVYCSGVSYKVYSKSYLSCELRYVNISANGIASILYDGISIFSAAIRKSDYLLLLGVSGAISLPLIRLFYAGKIITNIDGVEWRRAKWKGFARWFLKFSERIAIRYSDKVIADNEAIASYITLSYGISSMVIPYGGDHSLEAEQKQPGLANIPSNYAFSVCRIEPENNIHIILEAFSSNQRHSLVIVGNWRNSSYGKELREKYSFFKHLILLEPIYDQGILNFFRSNAHVYVHGHSAGGTNPSLVEAMHYSIPIIAYDCAFNRYTTENNCLYFSDVVTLKAQIEQVNTGGMKLMGERMKDIASKRYTWDVIAKSYFELFVD
jgi:glycosyltransferase involved in cell wall biosynthesis